MTFRWFSSALVATRVAVSSLAVLIAGAQPALAYIDPGTGSMILQLLAAAVAGSLFYVRRWRDLFMGWFFRRRNTERDNDSSAKRETD